MLQIILLLLIIFWFMGYGPLTALHIPLFSLGHFAVNLWDILIFLLILWLIEALPGVLRAVVVIALVVWLLGVFGFIVVPMFSNIVIIAIIVGLGLYLVKGKN
jgi:hypothetical protein